MCVFYCFVALCAHKCFWKCTKQWNLLVYNGFISFNLQRIVCACVWFDSVLKSGNEVVGNGVKKHELAIICLNWKWFAKSVKIHILYLWLKTHSKNENVCTENIGGVSLYLSHMFQSHKNLKNLINTFAAMHWWCVLLILFQFCSLHVPLGLLHFFPFHHFTVQLLLLFFSVSIFHIKKNS